MRRFIQITTILTILSILLPTVAFAERKMDPKDALSLREERMDEYVQKGVKAFQAEDYQDAAIFFEKAFRAKPLYVLLKNSMVAWYKNGDCIEAARTASRLVSIVGVEELSGKLDSEVTTVVNCALDQVDRYIKDNEVDEARQLLTIIGSTQPGSVERERINRSWVRIDEIITANQVPIEESMKFDDIAHYVGGALIVAGIAEVVAGTIILTDDKSDTTAGILLTSFGLPTVLVGSGLLVYWAYSLKKETTFFSQQLSAPPNTVLPEINDTPVISNLRIAPSISPNHASANVSVSF